MGSWRLPAGGKGDPRNLAPEVMHEQQELIQHAADESKRRREAERQSGSWWRRFWYWLKP